MGKSPSYFRRLYPIYLLLLTLPLLVLLVQRAVHYFIGALGQPANLAIDLQSPTSPLPRPWQGLAQGGEILPDNYLTTLKPQLAPLTLSYIRIDHLYDKYITVTKTDGQLALDFTHLDQQVDQVLSLGALPFFSLSYMPPAIAQNDITSPPQNWSDWIFIIQKTIEHYSGTFQNGRSLPNLYYEVWNEPDLFGNWKTSGERNYLNLYRYAAAAANSAKVTQEFKLGGPATTGFYPNWLRALLQTAGAENLKLDFISWHRYSAKPHDYQSDSRDIQAILQSYPRFASLPRIISEWGYTGDNHPVYDTQTGAAHLIATTRELLDYAELALTFEIQDGESPNGETFWGRWGLFTSPNTNSQPKPRYFALKLLNQLPGYRLPVSGEGTWVKAIAAVKGTQIFLLVTNYDAANAHQEAVPITLTHIPPATSQFTLETLDLYGKTTGTRIIPVQNQTATTHLLLSPNQTFLLRFTPQTK